MDRNFVESMVKHPIASIFIIGAIGMEIARIICALKGVQIPPKFGE